MKHSVGQVEELLLKELIIIDLVRGISLASSRSTRKLDKMN
jgi:hypothetical protein